ncbi:MAG: hypothetical protein PHU46_12690 [Rhodocyclaceae bacterium]|nr:hypothetical protein [Rhodocyclaceae bacterium]
MKLPISFLVPAALGVVTLFTGGLAMAGTLQQVHPLLNGDGGLALIVSGIALLLTGAFPLAIRMLTARG